jgi:hypothetical protein
LADVAAWWTMDDGPLAFLIVFMLMAICVLAIRWAA